MAFDAKRALQLMEEMQRSAETLIGMPEMLPIAREILMPVLNGHETAPVAPQAKVKGRHISEATRAKMRAAAAKRWAKKSQRKG